MIFIGDDYPEVRDLSSLLYRMGRRLSYRARAEHCRTAAISIYGLSDRPSPDERTVTMQGHTVELHIRFGNQPITLRTPRSHLIVIVWRGNGFSEIFNAPTENIPLKEGRQTISIRELSEIKITSGIRYFQLGPHESRPYLGNDALRKINHRDDDGGGGGGGGDGVGTGNGGTGSGGLIEVIGHPVLFSTDPATYRRLLEEY